MNQYYVDKNQSMTLRPLNVTTKFDEVIRGWDWDPMLFIQ